MGFGWGVGDIITISKLVTKVVTAYKDAPNDYKNIMEELKSLQGMIDKAAQHYESTTLGDKDRQVGQDALKGCESVLEDLYSLIEKYKSLASVSGGLAFTRVQLGTTENIVDLRARLTSNATLLSSFIRSCEFAEMQANLNNLLGLHRAADPRVSCAGNVNTKNAFKKMFQDLYQIGVRADMIKEKEKEIFEIFQPQNPTTGGQIGDSNIIEQSKLQSDMVVGGQVDDSTSIDQSQLQALNNRSRFRLPIDFLVGPLMLTAAAAGNTRRFTSTLEYVRNINFEGDKKETALHKAADNGHQDIVQLLLSQGASTEVRQYQHQTPLHYAARNGHTGIVELLLSKGASIEAINQSQYTPLHLAILNSHTGIVELLVSKGASIEAIDQWKNTPLHNAVYKGNTDIVKLLFSKGASSGARNGWNQTPLYIAKTKGYSGIVQVLENRTTPLAPGNR